MSAFAVATQDAAGPLAPAARRHGRDAGSDGDAEAGFDAALTDTAPSDPTTKGSADGSLPWDDGVSKQAASADAGRSPDDAAASSDFRSRLAIFASSFSVDKPAADVAAPAVAQPPSNVAPRANPEKAGLAPEALPATSVPAEAFASPQASGAAEDPPVSSLQSFLKNFAAASSAPAGSAAGVASTQTTPSGSAVPKAPAPAKPALSDFLSDFKSRAPTAAKGAAASPRPPAATDSFLAAFMATSGPVSKTAPSATTAANVQRAPRTAATPAGTLDAERAPALSASATGDAAMAAAAQALTPLPAAAPLAGQASLSAAAPLAIPAPLPKAAPSPAAAAAATASSSSPGNDADADAVALIGAAMASTGARPAAPAGLSKFAGAASRAAAGVETSPGNAEDATTSIHVVTQQTWLQPVSPNFSPGLSRVAAADRDALDAPHAEASKLDSAKVDAVKNAAGAASDAAAPQAALPLPSAPVAFLSEAQVWAPTPPGAGSGQAHGATAAIPAEASAASTTQGGNAPPLAATPRRDLEITLEPKELGGLAVKMKSAGDRLEIAFVADKGETARMISDKSATLESQLQGAGIGLGGIDISSAASQAGGAEWTSSTGGASSNGAGAGGDSQSTAQKQDRAGQNRQDQTNDQSDATQDARPQGNGRGLYL